MSEMRELKAWPFFGYAPGHYAIECFRCHAVVDDADKRAISCLECAVERAKAHIDECDSTRALPTSLGQDQELVEKVARAIHVAGLGNGMWTDEEIAVERDRPLTRVALNKARAALLAVREGVGIE